MRIIFLTTIPEPWGGSEELWSGAAERLLADGHRLLVLKTMKAATHQRFLGLALRGAEVRSLESVSRRARALQGAVTLMPRVGGHHLAALRFLTRLGGFRPDLVVICQGDNFDGALYSRLCRRFGLAFMVVSQKATETQWPAAHRRSEIRRAFLASRQNVFVADHNLRLTEELLGVRLPGSVVIANPAQIAADRLPLPWPTTGSADDGSIRMACVARLFPQEKGQDVLLRVLAREHWRRRALRVSFFGEGPGEGALRELASLLALDNVEFCGFSDDIEHVWREHHALVLPSRSEGQPLALIEALRCGRPAIVAAAGGIPELVEEGRTAFVAIPGDVDSLDAALERAWDRRDEWPSIGALGATAIRQRLSADPAGELAALIAAVGEGRDVELSAPPSPAPAAAPVPAATSVE